MKLHVLFLGQSYEGVRLTWCAKVAQGDLSCFDLAGDIFGHALVHALVSFPRVLNHQRAVFQKIQTRVISHVKGVAVRTQNSIIQNTKSWMKPNY